MIIKVTDCYNDYELNHDKPALVKLSKNFTLAELANNAGNDKQPKYWIYDDSAEFVRTLQAFRDIVNEPVIVNSGYRQPDYNRKIGGDAASRHIFGQAADIQPLKLTAAQHVQAWAQALGYTNHHGAINIYPNHSYYHLEINDNFIPLLTIRIYSTLGEYAEFKTLETPAIYVKSCIK